MARAAAAPALVEHRHHVETRWVTRQNWSGDERVPLTRFVCSCGVATKWYADANRARKDSKKHALDGQLAHP